MLFFLSGFRESSGSSRMVQDKIWEFTGWISAIKVRNADANFKKMNSITYMKVCLYFRKYLITSAGRGGNKRFPHWNMFFETLSLSLRVTSFWLAEQKENQPNYDNNYQELCRVPSAPLVVHRLIVLRFDKRFVNLTCHGTFNCSLLGEAERYALPFLCHCLVQLRLLLCITNTPSS